MRRARARTIVERVYERWRPTNVSIPLPYDPSGEYLDWAALPYRRQPEEKWSHNPATMASIGLCEYSRWKRDGATDREGLDVAIRIGRWLSETQDEATGSWSYDFDHTVGGISSTLEAPWCSALAQGQAMSLLTRLYLATSEDAFLDVGRRARSILGVDVAEGGLQANLFGHPFFEEYPTEPPSYTLNGFMFALIGLHDLSPHDPGAAALFREGMRTLVFALPLYDTARYSAYHLGHLTSPPARIRAFRGYHRTHVKELLALRSVWPDQVLDFYAREWSTVR